MVEMLVLHIGRICTLNNFLCIVWDVENDEFALTKSLIVLGFKLLFLVENDYKYWYTLIELCFFLFYFLFVCLHGPQ